VHGYYSGYGCFGSLGSDSDGFGLEVDIVGGEGSDFLGSHEGVVDKQDGEPQFGVLLTGGLNDGAGFGYGVGLMRSWGFACGWYVCCRVAWYFVPSSELSEQGFEVPDVVVPGGCSEVLFGLEELQYLAFAWWLRQRDSLIYHPALELVGCSGVVGEGSGS